MKISRPPEIPDTLKMLLTDMECEKTYEGLMRQTLRPQDKKTVLRFARAIESAVLEKLKAQEPFAYFSINDYGAWEETSDPTAHALYEHPLPPDDVVQKYEELLYAVQRKFPDETRHQTALRYIKTAEAPSYTNAAMKEMK